MDPASPIIPRLKSPRGFSDRLGKRLGFKDGRLLLRCHVEIRDRFNLLLLALRLICWSEDVQHRGTVNTLPYIMNSLRVSFLIKSGNVEGLQGKTTLEVNKTQQST